MLADLNDDRHTPSAAQALLRSYAAKASTTGRVSTSAGLGMPGDWRWLAIEERKTLDGALDDALALPFTVDRLLADERGELVIVDLKTAARLTGRWRSQWQRSLQLKLYRASLETLYGAKTRAVVVEGLEKASGTLVYERLPDWTPSELDEARALWRALAERDAEIAQHLAEDGEEWLLRETRFNYQDCFSYGYACEYLDLCSAPPELRLGLLRADFQIEESEVVPT